MRISKHKDTIADNRANSLNYKLMNAFLYKLLNFAIISETVGKLTVAIDRIPYIKI